MRSDDGWGNMSTVYVESTLYIYLVSTSTPSSVIATYESPAISFHTNTCVCLTICSNWADLPPSIVAIVHSSGHIRPIEEPWLRTGSMVNTMPGAILSSSSFTMRGRLCQHSSKEPRLLYHDDKSEASNGILFQSHGLTIRRRLNSHWQMHDH